MLRLLAVVAAKAALEEDITVTYQSSFIHSSIFSRCLDLVSACDSVKLSLAECALHSSCFNAL